MWGVVRYNRAVRSACLIFKPQRLLAALKNNCILFTESICVFLMIHTVHADSTSKQQGRDSSVGIATRYGLDGPGIESRWGARFSAPVQTGPGAHPATCTMGTGSFPGVKRPGRGADHPSPSKRRGHERVGLYLYSPSGPSWPVIGRTFTVTSKQH